MPSRTRPLLLLVLAVLLVAPAAASARTYSATVIAPAAADGAGHVRLPLLLSPRAERRASGR